VCAAGVGVALDLPLSTIRDGIAAITSIPGRLEPVPGAGGRSVYVDYAHTPDALRNALAALRGLTRGRVICVFGCGGDRDRGKRPQMGEIAGNLSDFAVITSDNPRTEAPMDIIREILPGVLRTPRGGREITGSLQGAEAGYRVEPDRREAIEVAIHGARTGDVVLIAGKGHETYQVIGREKLPFDDREEAMRALREAVR
jgi:UDP-N-acetylmuramyl-tripeptide synthetase